MAQLIREKIKDPNFSDVSICTWLTYELTEFRTGPRAKHPEGIGKPLPMGYAEICARRFGAAIGYAMLTVASLIELLVRVLIGAFCAPIAWRMEEDHTWRNKAITLLLHGSIYTLENYAISFAAFFQNVTDSDMRYDEIAPCFKEGNKYLVLAGILE